MLKVARLHCHRSIRVDDQADRADPEQQRRDVAPGPGEVGLEDAGHEGKRKSGDDRRDDGAIPDRDQDGEPGQSGVDGVAGRQGQQAVHRQKAAAEGCDKGRQGGDQDS